MDDLQYEYVKGSILYKAAHVLNLVINGWPSIRQ